MSSPAWTRHPEDVSSVHGGAEKSSSVMTWLQAAEHVLREEGPDMHIRELTSRIMELGMVKSNCITSLETLLYRQTSNSNSVSKFVRVSGKHGWFGLREDYLSSAPVPMSRKTVNENSMKLESIQMYNEEPTENEHELEAETKLTEAIPNAVTCSSMLESLYGFDREFEPRVFYAKRQCKRSYPSSGESSCSEDGVNYQCQPKKKDASSDEESITDETMYRKKYYFIKKVAKSLVFENAAMSDQLTLINQKITRAEAERKFLLDKLISFEKSAHQNKKSSVLPPPTYRSHPSPKPQPTKILKPRDRKFHSKMKPLGLPKAHNKPTVNMPKNVHQIPVFGNVGTRKLVMSEGSSSDESGLEEESSAPPKSKKKTTPKPSYTTTQRPVDEDEEQLELAMRCGKVRRLHPIALNKDGSPVFPIVIGGLKVHNLGKIVCDRPAYHSERYLLPIGFESSRTYPSMIDPTKKSVYTCRILDGGETPLFEMVADDDVEHPVRAASSTACQTIVLRNINKARDKQATNSGSGPEFFGYSNPTILNLLQKIPDSRKCSKYKFVRFAEPQRRPRKAPSSPTATKQSLAHSKKRVIGRPSNDSSGNQKRKPFHVSKQAKKPEDSGLAIAPVFGGMDTVSYSSSDDGSFSSEGELIIDN